MKRIIAYTLLFVSISTFSFDTYATDNDVSNVSTKQERNFIVQGNKLYKQKRYAEAEVQYRKALESVPTSEIANFNLAATLIRQSGSTDANSDNTPLKEAKSRLTEIAKSAQSDNISELAFYNLGNLAYNSENYAESIEMYKNTLRKNPDNDKARENLRLAQIKQKEQQNKQDNNNQQKDENKNQDQQQNNQQDQKKDDNDNKEQQQQNNQQNQPQQPQQPQQSQGISDANAEKILKAMENEEAATRKRIEAERKKEVNSSRRQVLKPW